MPLLNYTTSISAEKTVNEVQKALAKAGARSILSDYNDSGEITALSFMMQINETAVSFRLPADWQPVLYILSHDPKVPRNLRTEAQANRVAWRIIKDWVEAQLAIIETRMVKPEQAFLPYMLNARGETVYQAFANNPQFLLGGGK